MSCHSIDKYYTNTNCVLISENDDEFSCILSLTDLDNNKNRFYILQLINDNNRFILYKRYGRIGEEGKTMIKSYCKLNDGKNEFKKQFKHKTKNEWIAKHNFQNKNGYVYNKIEVNNVDKIKHSMDIKSILPNDIQEFIKMISNPEMIMGSLSELKFDITKLPFGKISDEQIDNGKSILHKIKMKLLNNESIEETFISLTKLFYHYLPYACGRKKPPVINNLQLIEQLQNDIEYIYNIQQALNIISSNNITEHPLDSAYNNINAKITPLNKSSPMWGILSEYLINTHGPTHKFSLNLVNILEIENNMNKSFDTPTKHTQLLFHGSRMCNWCSIIKNGFVLDPSMLEVHITGKMFGYGLYFTNSSSKSAQYCGLQNGQDGRICLLLAEVNVGTECKKICADPYINKNIIEKKQYKSVWGQGKLTPKSGITIGDESNGMYIPNGKLKRSSVNSVLIYDEKIVYSLDQIQPRYMMVLDLKWNK